MAVKRGLDAVPDEHRRPCGKVAFHCGGAAGQGRDEIALLGLAAPRDGQLLDGLGKREIGQDHAFCRVGANPLGFPVELRGIGGQAIEISFGIIRRRDRVVGIEKLRRIDIGPDILCDCVRRVAVAGGEGSDITPTEAIAVIGSGESRAHHLDIGAGRFAKSVGVDALEQRPPALRKIRGLRHPGRAAIAQPVLERGARALIYPERGCTFG